MYVALPLGNSGNNAVQVFVFIFFVRLVTGGIMCSQQFLCFEEIARLVFVGNGHGHNVQGGVIFYKVLQPVTRSKRSSSRNCITRSNRSSSSYAVTRSTHPAHSHHFDQCRGCFVQAVFCPAVALGYPAGIALAYATA